MKTGLVSIEESKKIVNIYQVDALDTKKVTLEEALMFNNEIHVRALKHHLVNANEALQFKNVHQLDALESGKTTVKEALLFNEDIQELALSRIDNITVTDALKFHYCFQLDFVESGRFTIAQASKLKNKFSDKLSKYMNISVEESINYIENFAPMLNQDYYPTVEDSMCSRLSYWRTHVNHYTHIKKIDSNNCTLDLFLKNLCTGLTRLNIIHIAEINENNQLIPFPLNISVAIDPSFGLGKGSTDVNSLIETYYSLFPIET